MGPPVSEGAVEAEKLSAETRRQRLERPPAASGAFFTSLRPDRGADHFDNPPSSCVSQAIYAERPKSGPGRATDSRATYEQAAATSDVLADDGYGQMTRHGITAVLERTAAVTGEHPGCSVRAAAVDMCAPGDPGSRT